MRNVIQMAEETIGCLMPICRKRWWIWFLSALKGDLPLSVLIKTTWSKSIKGYRYTINNVNKALYSFEVSLIKLIITIEIKPPKKRDPPSPRNTLFWFLKLKYNNRKDTLTTMTKRKLKL